MSSLAVGGSERQLLKLLNALTRLGVAGTLVLLQPKARHDLRPQFEKLQGFSLHESPYHWNDPRMFRWVQRVLRDEKSDLLLSLSPRGQLTGALLHYWEKYPHIIFERGDRLAGTRLFQVFDRWFILPSAKVVCCNSKRLAAVVRSKGVAEDRIELVNNIVDHAEIEEAIKSPAFLRDKSKINPEVFLIGYVGRFDRLKRLSDLIEAAALVEKKQPGSIHLVFIGGGPLRKNLEQQIERCGLIDRITFFGFVEHPLLYAKEFDAGVLCSSTEGASNVVLEYLALGVPVIASQACAEIIRHGENGLLFPVGDVNVLSEHIMQLVGNPGLRRRLANQGKVDMGHGYAASQIAEQVLEMFRRVL